ncbi:hypothetical protein NMG60_11024381 [Bertholletia excelsa]
MESANLHGRQHRQLQDQLVGSSSPLATYGVGSMLMNPSHNLSSNSNILQNDLLAPYSLNSSVVQGLGFQWHNGNNNISAHDLQLARVKGELSDSYTNKLNEMMPKYSLSSLEGLHSQATISYLKAEQQREFLSGGLNRPSLGSFSQILPTINISSLNQASTLAVSSSPLEMNLQALDLWASGRFDANIAMYKDSNALSHGLDLMQQPVHRPSNSPGKISPFNGAEAKRGSTSLLEPKVTQASQKKPRSDSRSCPPFKVRKEKLGDRIAALQQLVAPFGKTDTASVLMEAIGYIKFLQNQVETLSVPYMKSSCNNKTTRSLHGGLAADGSEEPRRDLRSRGLCLVPLSCLSYVADGGGVVWPPPHFTSDT